MVKDTNIEKIIRALRKFVDSGNFDGVSTQRLNDLRTNILRLSKYQRENIVIGRINLNTFRSVMEKEVDYRSSSTKALIDKERQSAKDVAKFYGKTAESAISAIPLPGADEISGPVGKVVEKVMNVFSKTAPLDFTEATGKGKYNVLLKLNSVLTSYQSASNKVWSSWAKKNMKNYGLKPVGLLKPMARKKGVWNKMKADFTAATGLVYNG